MNERNRPESDPGPGEIRILNLLIRDSRKETKVEKVPADSLKDYAQGRSTPEEARVIEKKLLNSADLRDELVYLTDLSDPETQARFDAEKVPPMKWMLWKHSLRQRMSSPVRVLPDPAPGRRVLVPAAVAVAVVAAALFFILRPAPGVSPWSSAPPLINIQFSRDPLRGGEVAPPETVGDGESAAVKAFHAVLEWKDGAFTMHEAEGTSAGGNPVSVTFQGAASAYTAAIPEGVEDVTVWFLSLPSLNRYEIPAGFGSTKLAWPDRGAGHGLVTISYRSGNEYRWTPAGEVWLSHR